MKNYCHACAIKLKLVKPVDASAIVLTGCNYQLEKFIKHTAPEDYEGKISVFFKRDYPNYRDYTIAGAASGSLQIDDHSRRNLIWYAGRDIGITYQNGIYPMPNDAVKVVLSEIDTGIHAFPVNYEVQYIERCSECGRALPS